MCDTVVFRILNQNEKLSTDSDIFFSIFKNNSFRVSGKEFQNTR